MHDKVKQGALHTVIRVHFSKGTFANVAVVASSGDPDLDNYVQACYVNMPPSLATKNASPTATSSLSPCSRPGE